MPTTRKAPAMKVESVPIAQLVIDDHNARRGDVDALMKSLREFGQHRAVVAQRGTKRVLIGNHMTLAAGALGWERIDVTFVDDDDETALRRSLSDNMVGDRARWDDDQLRSLLGELDDASLHSLPGIDEGVVARLLTETEKVQAEEGVFPVVARPGEAYTYVVVVAMNDIDGLWLKETMGLVEMRSYKSKKVALSRVIDVRAFKHAMNVAIRRGKEYAE